MVIKCSRLIDISTVSFGMEKILEKRQKINSPTHELHPRAQPGFAKGVGFDPVFKNFLFGKMVHSSCVANKPVYLREPQKGPE